MAVSKITVTELQQISLDKLIPYANNARTHSAAQINKVRASLRQFGFVNPIIIDKDYNILAGHGRYEAAKAENYDVVPCVFAENLTDSQKRAYILADNRLALDAGWDEEMLKVEIERLQEEAFNVADIGFDIPDLEELFGTKEVTEDKFDIDEELKKPVFSKLGDLWCLGKHRVICGDSTGEEVYTRLMDGQKANLILTDPPYNVDVEETAGKIMNDNMEDNEFYNFLLSAYKCMHTNLADDGSIYVWHADTEGLNFRKAFKDAGFYLSGCCIWKKNSLVLGRSPYQWIHEPCLFGWKQKGKHQWYSDRKQTTVWEYDKPKSSPDHPTMKPVPLMAYPIKNSTMTNGIVLDPFLGSGSTLIACCEMERICRGIELDPKYVDVIVKRYIEWQKGKSDDVYVIRDGEKLSFDNVIALESDNQDA